MKAYRPKATIQMARYVKTIVITYSFHDSPSVLLLSAHTTTSFQVVKTNIKFCNCQIAQLSIFATSTKLGIFLQLIQTADEQASMGGTHKLLKRGHNIWAVLKIRFNNSFERAFYQIK